MTFQRLTLIFALASILIFNSCTCPYKYMPKIDPAAPEPICVPDKIRVALVLGSGGVRGMAHVGVLEELANAGIKFDLIVGCSAGSIVGALYADNPDPLLVKNIVADLKADTILDINLWECRYGLSQGRSLQRLLNENLEAVCFDQLKIPLVVVATDLYSGELVPIGNGDLVTSVKASCAIPFVFVPTQLNGRVLVDGGCINPVPVIVAKDLGAEIIIAVDLCELLPITFPTNLFGVAKRSAEIAFLWQNQLCTRHADVIIRPSMCQVGTFNDKMRWQLYEAGREAAKQAIPRIKKILAELPPEDICQNKRMRSVLLSCYNADETISGKEFMGIACTEEHD